MKDLEKPFRELMSNYNFIIDGSNKHWYRFKFTNCISFVLTDDVCTLCGNYYEKRFVVIKEFRTIENLRNFLDGIFC